MKFHLRSWDELCAIRDERAAGKRYAIASALMMSKTRSETMMHEAALFPTLEHDPLDTPAALRAVRIGVKSRGAVHVLRLDDIDWVGAAEDYATLHVGAKSWLIRDSMNSLALRWASAGFVRIHRSTLLNVDRVRILRPMSKGEFIVVLSDGTELKLSRTYRGAAPRLAGYETTFCR